jgi:hypothetical protein
MSRRLTIHRLVRVVLAIALSTAIVSGIVAAQAPAAAPQSQPSTTPAPAAPDKKPAATAVPLPPLEKILARYREEIGGAAIIRKHTSRKFTGKFELPAQGIGGPVEVLAAAPNRMVLRVTLGALGTMERGFDGTTGWSIDPAVGPRLLNGPELDELKHSADYYFELQDPANYSSMTLLERTMFEGKDSYAVKLVRKSGFELTEYFDVTSGLLNGFQMTTTSMMGKVPGTAVLDGYKTFDGLLVPTITRQKAMGIESVITFDGIEFDKVPENAFAVPPQIATLAK